VTHATLLEACVGIYLAAILIELLIRRRFLRFILEATALFLVTALALLVNNAVAGQVAFGHGTSSVGTVAIMFIATMLGIVARQVFYLQAARFSWLDLFKPVTISPIVLLPLIGSVQAMGELTGMQIISFAVLAFQNGFFWQAVLEGAKPATRPGPDAANAKSVE
jgi:hypothetical protein